MSPSATLAILCAVGMGAISTTPVVVVADRDTKAYQQAIDGMATTGRPITRLIIDDPAAKAQLSRAPADSAMIALGPRSARLLSSRSNRNRAALFVRANQAPDNMSAVLLEVPYARQLTWIKSAFPGRRRLIVLRQPGTTALLDQQLVRTARGVGLEVVLTDVASAGEAVPALEAAIRRRDRTALLWLLPDPVAVSTSTVKPLIETALAARVPVVGFSDYFLRIGASAAVDVDYSACGRQALELADRQKTSHVPPATARLVVDGRRAERLGIVVAEGPGVEIRR